MIVALDGPAASGKGTLARKIAAHYGLPHLDTGLLYRAVASALIASSKALDDEDAGVAAALSLDLAALDRQQLSKHVIGEAASRVAVLPRVRAALLDAQRKFARQPGGAVIDGRDIGTFVCPEADVKFFVTASLEERTRRRTTEIRDRGRHAVEEDVRADLARRDKRDAERADAPMKMADDAHLLDTTNLDIEAAFKCAVEIIDRASDR
ncbi:MAG: (d)CMP kinase [Rhodobiaceae bacterium]|nr:(d)CMP kinase [Rhodobiaceae bacterium]